MSFFLISGKPNWALNPNNLDPTKRPWIGLSSLKRAQDIVVSICEQQLLHALPNSISAWKKNGLGLRAWGNHRPHYTLLAGTLTVRVHSQLVRLN